MGLVRLALRRPVTVSMFTVAAIAFGVVSFGRLPLNLLPDLSYPTLTLRTEYADAAPAEVENLVTRQVEGAVGVLKVTAPQAVAATLLIRVATLWFGVLLGAGALLRMESVIAAAKTQKG